MIQVNDNGKMDGKMDGKIDGKIDGKMDDLLGGNVSDELVNKNIVGFIVFFVVVICLIPSLLFKFKLYDILEVYFPNVDLIATALSFNGGPFNSNIFKFLYLDNSPFIGYLSHNIISYIAIISVIFIVIRAAVVHNNISVGLSKACIICFTTYLLPNRYIGLGMTTFNNMISRFMSGSFVWFIVVFVGLVISYMCIYGESLLLKHFSPAIAKFLNNIIKINPRKSKNFVSKMAIERIHK